jgi:UDP-MurNAc hydroxylase
MKITYLKSATVAVESNGVKILTDPWFTDGEYYGAWYHYPKFEMRNEFFADIDFIYVSHIHPDHFSKKSFSLLDKNIPVLIHYYESKFLKMNIERLGFTVTELAHNTRTHLKNGVYINVLAADNCNPELCSKFFGCGIIESKFGSTQIDTLSVIDDGVHTVVNTNDCPYELAIEVLELVKAQYPKIDYMLVGYGGAGPYPQCFTLTSDEKSKAIEGKKRQFLTHGELYIQNLKPRYFQPFAGTYTLGGKLAELQDFRGVPEIEEAMDYFNFSSKVKGSGSVGVMVNTYEYFDLESSSISKPYEPLDKQAKREYIEKYLSLQKLDYESEVFPLWEELMPFIEPAYKRMDGKRTEIDFVSETRVIISLVDDKYVSLSMKGEGYEIIASDRIDFYSHYVLLSLDCRLLKWILQGPRFAHWNNAEIGSHIHYVRKPNIFERGLYHTLNYFHS